MSREAEKLAATDEINHPAHYTQHPSGVECIQITEHMNFNCGNAVKYVWRADLKDDQLTNLHKARWYIDREIKRIEKQRANEVAICIAGLEIKEAPKPRKRKVVTSGARSTK